MNISLAVFSRAVENIVLAVCVTRAAIYFNRWTLLWFLVLVLLNQINIKVKENGKDEAADL